MPSVYAHKRFGEQVLAKLPASAKNLAEKYRAQYDFGLQGPDFLFFYRAWLKDNPVPRLGVEIHRQPASELFYSFREMLKNTGRQSMEMACALGTVCHFMLDSSCHWYVSQYMEESGLGHNEIETEFERYLLKLDGHDPIQYPIWELINPDQETAQCLANLYDFGLVDPPTAMLCMKDMKMVKKKLHAGTPGKQRLLRGLLKLSGHYEDVQGHIMALQPNPLCDASDRKLLELSDGAVEETAALAGEFYDTFNSSAPLNERFSRNFE